MKKICLSLIAIFCLIEPSFAQQAGTLDSSFNQTGIYMHDFGFHDNINDVQIQPDQKIILTGIAITPAFAGVLKVMRLKTNGTPDSSFAVNGVYSLLVGNESYGYKSAVTPDGKIIVAGITYDANYQADWLLLRLDSTGTIDPTFGNNGITIVDFLNRDDLAYGMALQPDGKIVVAGSFTDTVNFYNNPCIMRFTSDGIIDSTYGSNGYTFIPGIDIDNRFYNVVVQPNGKIVACGHYSKVLSGAQDFDVLVFRTDSTGNPDAGFGVNGAFIQSINGGIDDAFGLGIDQDDNIVVAGYTTVPVTLEFDMVLLKYDSTGAPLSTFGNSGLVTFNNSEFDVAMSVQIQPDNKIVAGGSSGLSFFGARDFALWRYLPDGTPDPSFGTNGFVTTAVTPNFQDCNSIALQNDGKIVAAGKTFSGTNNDLAVVRYHNDLGTSVQEIKYSEAALNVFPNPASSGTFITIEFNNQAEKDISVTMIDFSGREVFKQKKIDSHSETHIIHIPQSIQSGIYVLKISNQKEAYFRKLMVK